MVKDPRGKMTLGSGWAYAFPKREMPCWIKVLAVDLVDLLSLSPVVFIHE
jgi:hypothetical protein